MAKQKGAIGSHLTAALESLDRASLVCPVFSSDTGDDAVFKYIDAAKDLVAKAIVKLMEAKV